MRSAPRGARSARGRSTCPAADPVAELGALAERFARTPLTGRARDADGARHPVRMDGAAFAQLVNDAGYGYAIYRDVLAAARALDAGDPAPMLRLAAEDLTSVEAGPVTSYSEGAYAAVACHDYPAIWNVASPFAARLGRARPASRAGAGGRRVARRSPRTSWRRNSLYEQRIDLGIAALAERAQRGNAVLVGDRADRRPRPRGAPRCAVGKGALDEDDRLQQCGLHPSRLT